MNLIKQKKRGSWIIISGTTCAGKGAVIKELLKRIKKYSHYIKPSKQIPPKPLCHKKRE